MAAKSRLIPVLVLLLMLVSGQTVDAENATLEMLTPGAGDNVAQGTELRFQLASTPGSATFIVDKPSFVLKVDNCTGSTVLTKDLRQVWTVRSAYTLDITGLGLDLNAHRATMEKLVQSAYGYAANRPVSISDRAALQVPPGSSAEFSLRWQEVWDQGSLQVIQGGRIIAQAPYKALMGANLVVLSSQTSACAPARTGQPAAVATPSPTPQTPRAAGEMTVASDGEVPAASPESIQIVQDYLGQLNAGNLQSGYSLLHAAYRARLSYEQFQQGYGTVESVEVLSLRAIKVDNYKDVVIATLRIGSHLQNQTVYANWSARFEVMVDRGKPPYQRTITACSMRPMA